MYDYNYLAHHGVDGQSWGIRRGPPYPLLRNAAGKIKAKAQAKRKAKSEKAAADRANERQAFKKYLRENPEKLYKHRNELTKEEVDEIMRQIEWDRRVKDISDAEHQRNMRKVTNALQTTAQVVENSTKISRGVIYFKDLLSAKQNKDKKK